MSLQATLKQITSQPFINASLAVASRLLMAQIFILAGASKIAGYAATAGYMASQGVPGALLPLVILTELGGGLELLFGFQTRLVAGLLAGFCVITGLIFHAGSDQTSQIMLMKNLAMTGGLLALLRTGAGKLSVDAE